MVQIFTIEHGFTSCQLHRSGNMHDIHVNCDYILILCLFRNIFLSTTSKNHLLSRLYNLHSQILASFGIGSYGFINPIHNPPFTNLTGMRTQYSAILLGSCSSLIKSFRIKSGYLVVFLITLSNLSAVTCWSNTGLCLL